MSIDRQFGVHEIPGTEEPAPQAKRTVSASFEASMRDYVGAIWLKIGELERKVVNLEEWREELNYRLASRVSPEPERLPSAQGDQTRKTGDFVNRKPWEVEGVSRRTWYRRHKEGAA